MEKGRERDLDLRGAAEEDDDDFLADEELCEDMMVRGHTCGMGQV